MASQLRALPLQFEAARDSSALRGPEQRESRHSKRSFRLAEGERFELSVPSKGHNGFRDRPNRPLWHPSAAEPNPGGSPGQAARA